MMDLEQRIAVLEREVASLLMLGTVKELDAGSARVVVVCGPLETDWLPWLTRRAGNDRDWWAPEPGEQVMVLSPGGDPSQGVVLPAVYRSAHPAPASSRDVYRKTFEDGTVIEYDRAAHVLKADVQGQIDLIATGDINLTADGNIALSAARIDLN